MVMREMWSDLIFPNLNFALIKNESKGPSFQHLFLIQEYLASWVRYELLTDSEPRSLD